LLFLSGSKKRTPASSSTDEEREEVAQATTILVYQLGISPDNALAKLRTVASRNYRPVAQVARKIVENNGL